MDILIAIYIVGFIVFSGYCLWLYYVTEDYYGPHAVFLGSLFLALLWPGVILFSAYRVHNNPRKG